MRSFIKGLFFAVIALALGWIALWWYAEGRLQTAMTNWLNKYQNNGQVQISYDAMTRGTSPFAATITLINPRWVQTISTDVGQVTLSTTSVALRIDALNPLVMHVDFGHNWQIITPRAQGSITFGSIDNAANIDPHALFNTKIWPINAWTFSANDISVLASAGSLEVLHIDSFTGHTTLNPAAGAHQAAYSGDADIRGIALSPLLTKFANVPFNGKIDNLDVAEDVSGPVPADWQQREADFQAATSPQDQAKIAIQTLHDWAAGGGTGNASLTLMVGPSTLNASGNVAFDANVQPSGTAILTANHLDAFTTSLTNSYPQIQDDINNAETQLSPYLSTTNADGQILTIHAAYGKTGYIVNGTKITDMPPLDWDKLENPPAPPAPQAPGDGSGAATP